VVTFCKVFSGMVWLLRLFLMFVRVLLFECWEVVLLVWCSVRVFLLLSMCWCGLKDMVCILMFRLVGGGDREYFY